MKDISIPTLTTNQLLALADMVSYEDMIYIVDSMAYHKPQPKIKNSNDPYTIRKLASVMRTKPDMLEMDHIFLNKRVEAIQLFINEELDALSQPTNSFNGSLDIFLSQTVIPQIEKNYTMSTARRSSITRQFTALDAQGQHSLRSIPLPPGIPSEVVDLIINIRNRRFPRPSTQTQIDFNSKIDTALTSLADEIKSMAQSRFDPKVVSDIQNALDKLLNN